MLKVESRQASVKLGHTHPHCNLNVIALTWGLKILKTEPVSTPDHQIVSCASLLTKHPKAIGSGSLKVNLGSSLKVFQAYA